MTLLLLLLLLEIAPARFKTTMSCLRGMRLVSGLAIGVAAGKLIVMGMRIALALFRTKRKSTTIEMALMRTTT